MKTTTKLYFDDSTSGSNICVASSIYKIIQAVCYFNFHSKIKFRLDLPKQKQIYKFKKTNKYALVYFNLDNSLKRFNKMARKKNEQKNAKIS